MANVVHHHPVHHSTGTLDVPSRVYWMAGIGIALIALLFLVSANTASSPIAPALMEHIPFVPFIPVL